MAMSENAKACMLGFAMGLPLERCEVIVARWLLHYAFYFPPILELSMNQNELAAFGVGVMMERIETE